jgi:hypothetical protein
VSFQTRQGIPLKPDYAAAQRATRDAALTSLTRAADAPAPRIDEAERARRAEYVRETKAALDKGETFEQRSLRREKMADEWARWFRKKMDAGSVADPVVVLPDACARLEQLAEDRIAAAVRDLKATLRKAIS